jgi:N-carbamoyl-L-amino-acid hydrolase
MAEIGPGIAGGSNRQTVTDEDAEGRRLFQKWCEDAGLTMGVDQMGNMFMPGPKALIRTRCRSMSARTSTPSPPAGKYDGVLGVLGRA